MSATFKNAKRKLTQNELRKFMHEHKAKNQQSTAKITSPLAKYNESGQLICILCQSVVRSEAVWNVHINAKQHKQNIENAKALKEKTNNFTTAIKRPATPPPQAPTKKIKGILKNAGKNNSSVIPPSNIVVIEANVQAVSKQAQEKAIQDLNKEPLPKDFFDSGPSTTIKSKKQETNYEAMEVDQEGNSETLPEGFFDDPKLDAKARNIEFKDPIEEEWERFQREIKDADYESAAIIAEDQEEATTERQIDEIEEQMKNWSRVVELEKKKVEIIQQVVDGGAHIKNEDDSGDSDVDIDEFLDWRSKCAYK